MDNLQALLVPALTGAIVWIVVWLWQRVPWLKGLALDSANLAKLAAAVATAAVGALATCLAAGDLSQWWPTFLVALAASQAIQGTVKGFSPDKPKA